jgi:hypothetical protein
MKDALIDKAIKQIEVDLSWDDKTAIAELLSFVPEDNLLGYLGERYLNTQKNNASYKEIKMMQFREEIQRIQNSLRDWRDSDPEDNDAHWYVIIDALSDVTGISPQ